MAVKGVDISEHNGSVDFQALKNAGIEFVIIRCGYGSDYTYQDDSRFAENVRKADAAGMPWGVYLYSYAKNTSMAKSEAQHTLRLLNGRKPAYGVWYDVEDPGQANADLVSICETYCDAIEKAGLYCGIYSMVSWMNTKLNSSRLDKYDKWVAQWASSCQYAKPYGIWQYTDELVIGGKAFDGNWSYKDYPSFTTGSTKPSEPEKPAEEEEPELTEAKIIELIDKRIKKYFDDLETKEASNWSPNAIDFVKTRLVMVGDPNGKFRPKDLVTREELAQTIYNYDLYKETMK